MATYLQSLALSDLVATAARKASFERELSFTANQPGTPRYPAFAERLQMASQDATEALAVVGVLQAN